MRSRKIRLTSIILSLVLSTGYGQSTSLNQYPSYSSYSTLSGSQLQGSSGGSISGSGGGGSSVNPASSEDIYKSVDLTSNTVGVEGTADQGQRSVGSSSYAPQAQGSTSMYHYEMYPAPPKQNCVYTPGGMKCHTRREAGGGNKNSSVGS
jgi:hypothetical protein